MISLQVLGRLELRGADGGAMHSILAQPKRQALLAYLAVAVPRGYHRRDTLVGLLWPDSDEEHARASLSRAVNHLRQSLGADAIISRGHAELGIDWHRLWCDAAGFEEALDRGNAAEAMALYHGNLLPGFYIEEVPEFEQWLERERSRLRGRAVQSARLLSEREEGNGQLGQAVEWARRAAALEPLDESAVRRVMLLLAKVGDRAGALRTYEEFAAKLRSELESEPAAETTALMATIRDRQLAPASAPSAAPYVATQPPAPTAASSGSGTSAAVRSPSSRWRGRRIAPLVAAAIAGVAIATSAMLVRGNRSANASGESATVAVLPFVVQAGTPSENLGHAMVTLLSERINHSGILRAIDSRAMRSLARSVAPQASTVDSARKLVARYRPQFVLLGEIRNDGARPDSVHITAALFDSVARRPVARASVTGSPDDIARMSGEIVSQLLAARPTRREPFHERSATTLTPSVVAMRAFLTAEGAYVAGHFAEAARAYKTAVDADTTFALAYLYLGRAANWVGDYPLEEFAIQRAVDNIGRLSVADQLLVKAWHAYLMGKPVEAERLSRLILVNNESSMDAWYVLGEVRFHWGRPLGWTLPEARDAYERALTLAATAGTLVHLARIAATQGRTAAVDSLVGSALKRGVDQPQSLELRALRAHAMGDRAEVERIHAAIARLDESVAFSVVSQVAAHAAESPYVRDVAGALRQPRRTETIQAAGAMLSAQLALAHGRLRDAERALAPGPGLVPARSLEFRAALAVLPFRRSPAGELAQLRDALSKVPQDSLISAELEHVAVKGIHVPRQMYLLGLLALWLGDTATAERIATELTAATELSALNDPSLQSSRRRAAGVLRAEVLRAKGRPAEALAALGEPKELMRLTGVIEYVAAHERFLRAELNRDLKRWQEALRWYETFPDPGAYDLAYLPAVHAAKGAAHEALGNAEAAAASYGRANALLTNADPEFASLRRQPR